ncbi:MAG: hypothetical protein SFU25_08275 [Candidatus Caenarcaniphilales bacterium]|nr:hypothetical protein [Candidatus Caenarcaniphilales bacterium]
MPEFQVTLDELTELRKIFAPYLAIKYRELSTFYGEHHGLTEKNINPTKLDYLEIITNVTPFSDSWLNAGLLNNKIDPRKFITHLYNKK